MQAYIGVSSPQLFEFLPRCSITQSYHPRNRGRHTWIFQCDENSLNPKASLCNCFGVWTDWWGLCKLHDALCSQVWFQSVNSIGRVPTCTNSRIELIIGNALTGLPIQGAIINAQHGSFLGLQICSCVVKVAGGLIIGISSILIALSSRHRGEREQDW